jgi:preprotein translocase subunit YajC
MPEWLWPILIGVVIIGLIAFIYNNQDKRVDNIEKWKETRPMADEILTKSIHADICKGNMQEIKDVLIDNREILVKHVELLKEHLDLKLERDILSELRKLNNK